MPQIITGTPGAGKTLLAVADIYAAVQAGRLVYSNIDGLNIPGVLPLPDTGWTACKDGSLVVIDEAQQIFPHDRNREAKLPETEIHAMELHRHRGIDITLMTQHPQLIHPNIVRLCTKHRHLVRIMGTNNVRMYTMDTPSERLSKADLRAGLIAPWRHPKHVFGLYRSAQLHPPRQPLPRVLLAALLAVPALGAFAAYGIGNFFTPGAEEVAALHQKTELRVAEIPPPAPHLDQITGCYADRLRCRCMGPGGTQVTEAECRRVVQEPIRTAASREALDAAAARRGTRSERGRVEVPSIIPGV